MDGPTTYVLGVADVKRRPRVWPGRYGRGCRHPVPDRVHHSLEDVYLQFVEAPGGDRAR